MFTDNQIYSVFGRASVFAVSLLFSGCTLLKPLEPAEKNFTYRGMVKVPASGKSFPQGADDSLALADEKPVMQSGFTYDYWLDTTEVTQKEYEDVTGKRPVSDTSRAGFGDRYPVYYVSWFDAALYCNEKSKRDSLDTIYSYSAVKVSLSGSVYDLTGLTCDLTKNGFRLPTEAEWEFADREASSRFPFENPADSAAAFEYAWFAANSGNATHPVAQKKPNARRLYDMAGNVFEWTNDWKGAYAAAPITNSLGVRDPDREGEKVLKGGSFRHAAVYLRPSRRSATYATTLSAVAEYAGFRCCRGVIPAARYINYVPPAQTPNPVMLQASDLGPFAGTAACRLVFVNVTGESRTLCSVDFSQSFPFVREFTDDKAVYTPAISPDGRFAAWSNGGVGLGGPASVSVRCLDSAGRPPLVLAAKAAYVPRWWVNDSTNDTFLVYTNSAIPNSNAEWNMTATFLQKMSGGAPAGTPQVLVSDGSFHDGLSANGQYIVTSYDRLLMRDLRSGQQQQLFTYPDNGKEPDGSTQVCNASMCPDPANNGRCMFLDFGCPTVSRVTGCSYGIHEFLFMSMYTETVFSGYTLKYLRRPAGEQSWDHPQWSNNGRYAVACGRNSAGQAENIYLVNLEQGSTLRIASGTELQHPYFWRAATFSLSTWLSSDSLGAYDVPHIVTGQRELAYKMHLFWKKRENLDLVFIGNSNVEFGIDCGVFTGFNTMSLSFAQSGMQSKRALTDNYLFAHAKNLKLIAMEIPFYYFSFKDGEDWVMPNREFWDFVSAQSKGFAYDKNNNYWRDSLPRYFDSCMLQASYPRLEEEDYDTSGQCLPPVSYGWESDHPALEGTVAWTTADTNYLANFASLTDFIRAAQSRNIHVLAIAFPESPYYKNTDHYTRYGPSWETGREVLAQVKSLQSQFPLFHVYDAYLDGNHDYADSEAFNCNHLNAMGARKLSLRLDTLIQSILK